MAAAAGFRGLQTLAVFLGRGIPGVSFSVVGQALAGAARAPTPGSAAAAGAAAATLLPLRAAFTTSAAADESWQSMRQSFTSIRAEVDDAGVAVLTIDRPQALNALNATVRGPKELGAQAASLLVGRLPCLHA